MFSAQVEHSRWVAIIKHSVENNQPINIKSLFDHRKCSFGEWYYNHGQRNYAQIDSFQKLDSTHKRVHVVANEIDRYLRDGELDTAKQSLLELLELKNTLIKKLKNLSLDVAHNHNE
jgi:methyl-accepting chemotaxis protein